MCCTFCCQNNSAAERFFCSLKVEWTEFENDADVGEAGLSALNHIGTFCNHFEFLRLSAAWHPKTPNENPACECLVDLTLPV